MRPLWQICRIDCNNSFSVQYRVGVEVRKPHYLAKFECSTVQLHNKFSQFRSDAKSFYWLNIYHKC